jgi:S1-C subfamily serine protease
MQFKEIYKFENWLSNSAFLIIFLILLLANLLLYSLIFQNYTSSYNSVNRNLIYGLNSEKDRLIGLLAEDCNSPKLNEYKRGDVGPLPTKPERNKPDRIIDYNSDDGQYKTPDELNAILQKSTVRVLTKEGSGSGFFINSNTIVTNRHVVEKTNINHIYIASKELGSKPLQVTLSSMTKDSNIFNPDLAILHLDKSLPTIASLSISNEPSPLQSVIAAGYPGISIKSDNDQLIPNLVLTAGEVSVLQPQSNGSSWVIHTAQISPGSSGGSLVNRCGSVVGINTLIGSGQDMADGRTLYAMSSNSLMKYLDEVGEKYKHSIANCKYIPK